MGRTHGFTAACGERDAQALVTLVQGREDGLNAFFLVVTELNAGGEQWR